MTTISFLCVLAGAMSALLGLMIARDRNVELEDKLTAKEEQILALMDALIKQENL